MKIWAVSLGAILLLASAAQARNLCDILKEKGVLNDIEYNECKAEQEKDEQKTEKKAQEVVATKWPKWLDMLTPFGDLRLRQEGFYENHMIANNRTRIRARLGLNVVPSDEVAATFRLASGNPNDPISTNQTLDKEFTRKPFNLDWAYLAITPSHSIGIAPGWFTILGGKFGMPNYRITEAVWDDDLSPEGATEMVNFWDQKEGFLRGLKLNVNQWIVDQVANGGEPWMWGTQIVANTAFGSAATWTAAFADYYFDKMNVVAKRALNPSSSNYNSSLANSNSVITENGQIVAYAEGFNVLNWTTDLDFANPFGIGIPAGVFGDFMYNTLADGNNTGFWVGAGIGRAGRDYYHDSLKNVGDWGLTYTSAWVEKNALVSLFAYSDINYQQQNAEQKGATNVIANMIRFDYLLFPNFQLTSRFNLINALDRAASNATLVGNSTLVRMQLDAQLRF